MIVNQPLQAVVDFHWKCSVFAHGSHLLVLGNEYELKTWWISATTLVGESRQAKVDIYHDLRGGKGLHSRYLPPGETQIVMLQRL